MRCDICGSSDNVFFIQSDPSGAELRLCRACALAKGYAVEGTQGPSPDGSRQADAAEGGGQAGGLVARVDSLFHGLDDGSIAGEPRCPFCGSSLAELRSTGRIGCSACASAFKREILVMRKRSGRYGRYEGKVPASAASSSVPGLEERLAAALREEDFEEAAALRDRLRALGGQPDSGVARYGSGSEPSDTEGGARP